MAMIAKARLRKKYGPFKNYSELCSKIIEDNHLRIANKVSRMNNEVFVQERARVRSKEKAVNLPTMESLLLKRVEAIKSKDRGKWIADNLKSKITQDLKGILEDDKYKRTRGKLAGTLKEQAITDFQAKIRNTFENYTKVDPKFGVPSNIRNIAVTEVRTVVDNAKDAYMNELLKRNDDIFITKTFIHNNRASKVSRPHHEELNGVTIPKAHYFVMYNKKTGRTYRFMYPHDPNLPADETIGCSCEVQYKVSRRSEEQRWMYREGE